ncbi:MAG: hypothetical protein V4692_15215 [Bdellovibrionota bacterium]
MKKLNSIITTLIISSCGATALASIDEGRFVVLRSGHASLSSNLTGSGTSTALQASSGILFDVDVSYQPESNTDRYGLSYFNATTNQTTGTGVTPRTVDVEVLSYQLHWTRQPWSEGLLSNFRFGLGYGYLESGASNTTPFVVMTNQKSHGPVLLVEHGAEPLPKFLVISKFQVYVPFELTESVQRTGYNRATIGLEASLDLEYLVQENFAISLGVGYQHQQSRFEGTGTRGVTDGTDARKMLKIPVGIKIGY